MSQLRHDDNIDEPDTKQIIINTQALPLNNPWLKTRPTLHTANKPQSVTLSGEEKIVPTQHPGSPKPAFPPLEHPTTPVVAAAEDEPKREPSETPFFSEKTSVEEYIIGKQIG